MSIAGAWAQGIGRVARAPLLVVGIYIFSLALAVSLGLAVRAMLTESLGASLVAENMRTGFDLTWHTEFASDRTDALAPTFGPWVTGSFAAILNVERLLDGKLLETDWIIGLAGILWLFAWAFFAGGIIDRYANPEAPHLRVRFFSHCAEYFPTFTQLLILAMVYYWAVFKLVAGPLHRWVERATLDVTVERTVIAYTAAVYLLVGTLLWLGSLVLDYARISTVVEKRRGLLRALAGGAGFVARHPLPALGLSLLLVVVTALVIGGYLLIAPGPGQSTPAGILAAFAVGQAYVVARLIAKLWTYASQTALMQDTQAAPLPAVPPAQGKSLSETWGE
jgi:hypothetical protein